MEINSRFYSSDRQVLGKACPLDTPYRFAISISEVCNFKCVYCFRSVTSTLKNGYTTKEFMTMDLFEKVIEQAKAFPSPIKKIFLNITGEPLCHKELPQMISYVKRHIPEPTISIQTNGSLLNPNLSEKLASSGLDHMLISLQGISSEKYKQMCGVEIDFEKFIRNIKYLYENRGGLQLFVKIPDISLEKGEEGKYHEIFDPISDQATVERINPVFKEVDYTKIHIDPNDTSNRLGTNFGKQDICPFPFYGLSVTTNGNVYPCVQSIIPCVYGNVNDESLLDIWNGSARTEFLKKSLRKQSISVCDTCTSKSAYVLSSNDIIDDYCDDILARMEVESHRPD